LFTIILGEINPLNETLFAYPDLWLGITVSGDSEMTPRQRLTSVPYALHTPAAGGTGSGWVADGGNVYLEDENDNVGIGTASPAWKLDVAGGLNVSDSLIANKVRIGSSAIEGEIGFYGPLTNGPYLEFGERWNGGGDFFLKDAEGDVVVGFQANNTYGGYGYGWLSRNDGTAGITIWGGQGGSDDPRLELNGQSRDLVLNMAESGDDAVQLPTSSISSSEMKNEPGLSNSVRTSSQALGASPLQLDDVYINCPSDGYVLVFATFNLITWHQYGTDDFIYLKITDVASASFPSTYSYIKTYLSTEVYGQRIAPVTLSRYFSVDAGGQYFYLYGAEYSASTSVDDIILTAVFVPSWYGSIYIPGVPGMEEETDTHEPGPSEIERIIDERVKQETSAIESRFEAQLAAFKEELLQTKGK